LSVYAYDLPESSSRTKTSRECYADLSILRRFILRFVVFRFRESPKFLIYRGHDDKAALVLQQIAKFNGQECHVTQATFDALTEEDDSVNSGRPMLGGGRAQVGKSWGTTLKLELDRYALLFSNFTIARITILVWLTYFCD